MKRILTFVLAMILLLAFLPIGAVGITANAASGETNGFTYEVYDGKAIITGSTEKNIYELVIPDTIDGYPVVGIGDIAFQRRVDLVRVIIPEGVETIGVNAFYDCRYIRWLQLPDSLVSIGDQAFSFCTSIEEIDFGEGLKSIGYAAFSYCTKLDFYLELPDNLEVIGGSAFYRCDTLKTVILPKSLQEIGAKAFAMCTGLDYIYIPDGIPKIGAQLLNGSRCYSYENDWYNGVYYIGRYALEANKTISGSCKLLVGTVNIADGAFENCDNLTEVILPDSLQIIGNSAFKYCDNLKKVNIPEGVISIGDEAFYECESIEEINIPESVAHLGQDVFVGTGFYNNDGNWENGALYIGDHLVSSDSSVSGVLQVRAGTKTISNCALKGRRNLTELVLPNTVTTIGYEAFAECTALTKVTISDSVTDIGEKAFHGCSALKTVDFGKSVSHIGTGAFSYCPNLENITIDGANEKYYSLNNCLISRSDKSLALGCKTSQIPTDGTVTAIGAYAFEGCDGLTQLNFPDAILTIGEGAFKECDKLVSVSLGNGVQVVGKRAFENCDMLASIDFGTSVHTIDDVGFGYNHQLTNLVFPESLRFLGEEAFSNCTGLVSVTFPEGIVSIGKNCFYFCENLTSLHLPDSLQTINDGAFYCCEKVATLTLGKNLISIGTAAFLGCETIELLEIPENVMTIGNSAFSECTNLKQVDLGNVEKIGSDAFSSCKSLPQIHIPETVESIGLAAFAYCPAIEQMTVDPQNEYYHSQDNCIIHTDGQYLAFGCKNSIIPDDGSVTTINGYSFAGCTGLKRIVVPECVTRINYYAFYECYSLEEMYLPFIGSDDGFGTHWIGSIFGASFPGENDGYVPNSLKRVVISGGTDISTSAFQKCRYLEEIVLPETITTIGYHAFDNCTRLQKVVFPGDLQEVKEDVNIFATAPNAFLCISNGQDDTKNFAQSNGVRYQVGGLITFTDENGQCIEKKWYPLNAQISPLGMSVAPGNTEVYTPALGICTGNQTVTRQEICPNEEFVVTFQNPDGTVLSQKTYYWGDPVVPPENPTRPEDRFFTYTFAGWDKPIVNCAGSTTYTATYNFILKDEKVIFKDWDGTVLSSKTYKDGEQITFPADPKRPDDAEFTYTFDGWSRNVSVEGDLIYTAMYIATPKEYSLEGVIRVYGATRYDTAFKAADTLKAQQGVDKFSTIVVASGTDFADALAGSYLANQKNAPILLVRNRAQEMNQVKEYIRANLKTGGTVYLLGGVNAVPKAMEMGLDGFNVKRLGGATRYDTNLLILKEAGVAGKDIIVCTGKNFADSLSASATGLPILLVKDSLSASQKEFLASTSGKKIVVGGTAAVNARIENALKAYGTVKRLAGNTRYDTSVLVAKEFFKNPTSAVLAYAQNFPDGLSGGALAYALNAPLILTDSNKPTAAVKYGTELGIKNGYVLGGTGLISDKVVRNVFSMATADKIIVK